jgi:hypothetical protein
VGLDADVGRRSRRRPGETRYAAAVATLAAIALYAALPNRLVVGPRLLVPLLEPALLVVLVVADPRRMTRESTVLRGLSIALMVLIGIANATALVLLVHELVSGSVGSSGGLLLLGAGQVWVTNMVVFGLAFWELDRGGPVVRTTRPRAELPAADFRFPQDEDHDAVVEVAKRSAVQSDWTPLFFDYLYVSITNSMAFSPTDTMPLTHRAKALMTVQALTAMVLSIIVIARGVNILR